MLTFQTAHPQGLLDKFKDAIRTRHIVTWSIDSDGDFTHNTDQWRNKAWLRPKVVFGALELSIITPKNATMSREVYAIYHGRFIESMLAHFDTSFTNAYSSALGRGDDRMVGTNTSLLGSYS